MSLPAGMATLTDARRALEVRWEQLRRTWDDAAAQRFEETFIRPMDEDLRRAIHAMGQAQEAARRAHRDCNR